MKKLRKIIYALIFNFFGCIYNIPMLLAIQPIPCTNYSTGEFGVCMFDWSCHNVANGIYIGSCVDRFFIGTCCKISKVQTTCKKSSDNTTQRSASKSSKVDPSYQFSPTVIPQHRKERVKRSLPSFIAHSNNTLVENLEIKQNHKSYDNKSNSSNIEFYKNFSLTQNPPILEYIFESIPGNIFLSLGRHLENDSHNQRRSAVEEDTREQRRPVIKDDSHDQRWPVIKEDTHDPRWPVIEEDSHDQRRPVIEDDSRNQRWPVIKDDSREKQWPVLELDSHDQRWPVIEEDSHDQRWPVIEDDSRDQRWPVIEDDSRDQRWPVIEEDSHDQRWPVIEEDLHEQQWSLFQDGYFNYLEPPLKHQSDKKQLEMIKIQLRNTTFISTNENGYNYTTNATGTSKITISNIDKTKFALNKHVTENPFSEAATTSFSSLTFYPNIKSLTTTEAAEEVSDSNALIPIKKEVQPYISGSISKGLFQVCGRSRSSTMARIVGGQKSRYLNWPWVISLRRFERKKYMHKCGATLLNKFWAITAAHCVKGKNSLIMLRIGVNNILQSEELHPYVERQVSTIVIHPDFNPLTYENDLALLRYSEPIKIQPNIIPVCLPRLMGDVTGHIAVVTGWGRLSQDGDLAESLHEVYLPIISNKECERLYSEAGFAEKITDVFICAGLSEGGLDACEGDSGGPMVVRGRDGEWILVGLISWGMGCADPKQPGVYTRISSFSNWIEENIAN